MARGKRHRRDVYRTDMNRYSVYPSYSRPKENIGKRYINIGDIIKVRVTGLDDDGNPTGTYLNYTIIIEEKDLEPGANVTVRIKKVEGKTAYGEVIAK